MPDINIVTNEKFAPAKEMIDARLRQVMRGDIKLMMGAGSDELPDKAQHGDKIPAGNSICIMEATSYILGYENVSDAPPCTSQEIRNFMIEVNDADISDRKRAMLKQLIPEIINTSPLRWNGKKLVTYLGSSDYKNAEDARSEMISAWKIQNRKVLDSGPWGEDTEEWDERLTNGKIPMARVIEFVRELVAIAKFDKGNGDTSVGITDKNVSKDAPVDSLAEETEQRIADENPGNMKDSK